MINFDPSKLTADMRLTIMAGVVRATELVRTEVIDLILRSPHTGKMYGKHQASAPGEPPASNKGNLVNMITTRYDTRQLTGTVIDGSEYGPMLEFGTQTIEPRPHMRPALANKQAEVLKIIEEAVTQALRMQK